MEKGTGGLSKEDLVEFFKETVEVINLMNRRQRWQFRRDLKEYCRFANVRYPFGKEEDDGSDSGESSGKPGDTRGEVVSGADANDSEAAGC